MVELLVGAALGLLILTGIISMFVGGIGGARRLLLEARLEQDVRAAMDLIVRDLRRGAYWGNAIAGTVLVNGAVAPNPYGAITTTGTGQIEYAYSRDSTEDNALGSTEQFGLRLNTTTGGVEMRLSGDGSWQPLTDTDAMVIQNTADFTITPTVSTQIIPYACPSGCTPSATVTCPSVQIRSYRVVLKGTSRADSAVSRTLTSTVRVRNDVTLGACPA